MSVGEHLTRCRVGSIAASAIICFALSACGSSESTKSATGSDAPAATASGSDAVAEAVKATERNYTGTDGPLPKDGPPAQKGKRVWIISCYKASPGCQVPSEGVAEAGKELGWKTTIADAKLDPNEAGKQIRAAVAAKADAIVLVAVPCSWAPGALQSAKAAGVKIYGALGFDCDHSGGEKLFDGTLIYSQGGPLKEYIEKQMGPAIANYVIAKTGGKAKVLTMEYDDGGIVIAISDAVQAAMKEQCPDCELHTASYTGQDVVQNKIQAKTTAALTRYPGTNVVLGATDGSVLLGRGQAVSQAEASGSDILTNGVGGFAPNLELIADGGPQDFTVGEPGRWEGWATADGLNRVLAGEPQVNTGIGLQVIDKDHPSPSGVKNYDGNARSRGYADNYRRIWAGEGQSPK